MSMEKSLGTIAASLTIIGSLIQFGVLGGQRIPGLPGLDAGQAANLSISRGSGPSGMKVRLRGSGFSAGETVEIRFATDQIARARVGKHGGFRASAFIPGTFDVFGARQYEIVAVGMSSAKSADVPFQLIT